MKTKNQAAKHTPGPWKLITCAPDGREQYAVVERDNDAGRVLGVLDKEDEQDEANARLIAAAPELLEALKEVVRISNRKHDAWDAALAAIAQAEGK